MSLKISRDAADPFDFGPVLHELAVLTHTRELGNARPIAHACTNVGDGPHIQGMQNGAEGAVSFFVKRTCAIVTGYGATTVIITRT